jgi:sigma-B regulation protein RsbU (phosphoserine phosphatase)
VALGDVAGHGEAVSSLAERLQVLMQEHINTWDQSQLMRDINDSFQRGLSGVEYATLVVLGYYRETGQLLFTNAGHPPPLWYHASQKRWGWLEEDAALETQSVEGLPVGMIPGTAYRQTAVRLCPGDLLAVYSDALPESNDADGQELGAAGPADLAASVPTDSAVTAGEALLEAVRGFRGGLPAEDDETLMVLRRPSA